MRRLLTVLAMLVIGTAAGAGAGENGKSDSVTPVLAPDAKVMAVVNGLGEGASADLPPIKAIGDINEIARQYRMEKTGPCGRNYCIRMMWMPERKRAIFCGANHAVPHRLNDVWEYDLASNTWVCLYGPDMNKGRKTSNWADTSAVDGVLRTERGGPAIIGHQWWQLDYDPELKAMLFLSCWPPYVPKEVKEKLLPQNRHKPPLWAFYPEKKKWEPITPPKDGKAPRPGYADYFQYVPPLKRMAYVNAGYKIQGMWLYNPADNTWKKTHGGEEFKAKNNPATPVNDGVMVYVPDRNLIVACSRTPKSRTVGRTVHYDVKTAKWSTAAGGPETPAGHSSFTPCGYDAVGKMMFLYDQKANVFWGYDPGAKKWAKITPKGPAPPTGNRKVIGYYDEARNVFVLNQASKVWVYRHRRAAPAGGDG